MNKRALMLTAAATALLSGHAYGASPCSTTTSTAGNCDITTEFQYPLYTGAVPAGVTTGAQSTNGSMTIDTNGSLVLGINPPTAPAITINSGTSVATQTTVNNTTEISYQGISYVTGVLLEESAVPTAATGAGSTGAAENWTGEFYNSTGTIDLLGAGTNKTAILIAGGAYPGTSGTTNAATGVYANQGLGVFTGATGYEPTGGSSPVAIYLASGSTTEVQGTNSFGINLIGPTYNEVGTTSVYTPSGGASLIGDIDVGGSLIMTPTTVGSTSATGNIAINIAGWEQSTAQPYNPALAAVGMANAPYAMVGNLNILQGGTVSSEGAGAQGIVVLGAINGAINNSGQLETFGTTAPSTALNASDPEGGQALVIANNVTGGIFNGGPTSGGGTSTQARATMSMVGDSETIDIASAYNTTNNYTVPVTIGGYTDAAGYTYSLLNRGNITAAAEDANISDEAIFMSGVPGAPVTLTYGIFNAGAITSTAVTNTDGSTTDTTVTATAIDVGNFVTIGTSKGGVSSAALTANGGNGYSLVNSNETGSGTISATLSGAQTGTATAIVIEAQKTGGAAGSLTSIYNAGTISASASTTNLDSSGIAAYAIRDESGTLQIIYNTGSITATSTTLDNNSQVAVAIDTSSNSTSSVTIDDISTGANSAEIVGDIKFGSMAGTLNVTGTNSNFPALVSGNISFNNNTATPDTLNINQFATVSGEITELNGGSINISVAQSGTLDLLTSLPTNLNSTVSQAASANTPLKVQNLTVSQGALLDISLSQGNNVNAFTGKNVSIIDAQNVNIGGDGVTPTMALTFGGFVASPSVSNKAAQFVLISAPSAASGGVFNISSQELNLLINTYDSALNPSSNISNGIPFLFTSDICTYNVAAAASVTGAACATGSALYNAANQELVLTLTPKTAQQIGLTGYALKMFPYVNEALVNDNTLGAAMINSIKDTATAQAAYASYAPDVSGATRATAISLTDSATNIVAARQQELRMYANQEGETTLWGQQFAERLSQANSSTLTGYNDSGFGFVLGMDDGDRADGRYGGAFTFFTGGMSAKEPTSSKTSSEYYMLTGYTDWRGKGLFIDTQGTVGYANLKGNRYLTLFDSTTDTTLSRDAQSQRASELLAGSVTMGGILTAGSTVFMPQVDVDGLTMREEGYTESNGGQGFDLRVQPYYADSLRAFVGADLRQDFNFGDFYLQPQMRAGYRYDFLSGAEKLKANFASVSSVNGQTYDPFSIEGPDPGHGNIVFGGGIATTTGAWSIGLNYDYVKASNGPSEQSGVLTLVGRI